MVSVLQGTSLRKQHKHKWWMYKLLFLCVVSALALGISLTFFHTKSPILRDRGIARENIPDFETFNREYYSVVNDQYSIERGALADETNSSTPNNGEDNDDDQLLYQYFKSINASNTCDFGTVPYNMTCSYLSWNESGCATDNKYLKLLHCTSMHEAPAGFYVLAVLIVLLSFYLLGDTAEAYFSPSLIKISNYLKLSPNLAGITLLALGNGAPDLSAIIVGIVVNENTEFGVGEPVGSGTFVTSCVLAAIILFSDVKGLSRRPFVRDVCFYIISVGYTFYLYIDGRVFIWESIICLLIYVVYVLTVIIGRIIYKRIKARRERLKGLPQKASNLQKTTLGESLIQGDSMEGAINSFSTLEPSGDAQYFQNGEDHQQQQEVELVDTDAKHLTEAGESDSSDEEEQWVGWRQTFVRNDIFKEMSVKDIKTLDQVATSRYYIPKVGLIESKKTENGQEEKNQQYIITDYFHKEHSGEESVAEKDKPVEHEEELKGPKKYIIMFLDSIGWSEMAWYQKITFIVFEWFWILLRNLTIPKSEDEEWNKWFAMCIPIFSPLIMLILPGYDKFIYLIGGVFPVAIILILFGTIFSVIIFFTTRRNKPPRYHPVFVVFAFPMCIFWIFIICNELLDVLDAVGLSVGIPTSVLAITVLSWGNSISDMIADVVISKQGYPSMALGAVFAGPMLNLLIGLFVALTFNHVQLTKLCFPLTEDPTVNVSFIFLLISLISSVTIIPIFKFRAPKLYGVYLIGLYLVYLTIALLAALYPPVTAAFTWRAENMCPQ